MKVVFNGGRKPVSQLTDRAKRYRANSRELRPPAPKRCAYCGSSRNVGVDHVDGNESNLNPGNLLWACKSCNSKKAHVLRRAGLGRLTRQFNPARRAQGSRRSQMLAYGQAIKVMRGEFEGDVSKAVETIQATPASIRSAYTSRGWSVRKNLYGPSGRRSGGASEVPF